MPHTYVAETLLNGARICDLPDDMFVACYAEGTEIQMSLGKQMIEGILLGDPVKCGDGQIREVHWIGRHRLDAKDLANRPHLRPICITAGALGQNLPEHDLRLAPEHRIVVGDRLIAAKHLVNGDTIFVDTEAVEVCYFQILFEDHQIIFSNGVKSESLFPGDEILGALANRPRAELIGLFAPLKFGRSNGAADVAAHRCYHFRH